MKHKHYDLMLLAISNPNLKFEKRISAGWIPVEDGDFPDWYPDNEYRVAQPPVVYAVHPHADVMSRYIEDTSLVVEFYVRHLDNWLVSKSPNFHYDLRYRIAGDK